MSATAEPKTQAAETVLLALVQILQTARRGDLDPKPWVVTIVTEVEGFVDALLDRVLDLVELPKSDLGSKIAATVQPEMSNNWPSRHEWLKVAIGSTVLDDKVGMTWNLIIELRNAIVHGGGSLTRRQQQGGVKSSVALEKELLRHLGVEVVRGRLLMPTDLVERVVRAARAYVIRVDEDITMGHRGAPLIEVTHHHRAGAFLALTRGSK